MESPKGPDPRCTIEEPVRLTALSVPFAAGRSIALPGHPIISCRLATAVTEWTGRIAAPVIATGFGAELKAMRTGPGFACRPRNREPGAKLSAHGQGLALDIAGFDLADGRMVAVGPTPPSPAGAAALASIRTAACGWFLTVLGPGSDPSHADHLHLDLQIHGRSESYRMCQ